MASRLRSAGNVSPGAKNIVFILTDQLRADVAYHERYAFVQTPNLDRLRGTGVTFNRAFCQSPICGPSRAAITTGRYPLQTGVTNNRCILPAEERTIGHQLHDAGRDVVAFGKTHGQNRGFCVAAEPPLVPSLGTSTWGPYKKPPADPRTSNRSIEPLIGVFPGSLEEHYDFVVARQAVEFLRGHDRDRPFFLFVGIHGPHPPFLPPKEFADLYKPGDIDVPPFDSTDMTRPAFQRAYTQSWCSLTENEQRRMIAAYLAQVSHVDAAAGRIIDAVDSLGLGEDTAIVFSSDHGDQLGDHGITGKFHNFYDASARCPLVIRTPHASARSTSGRGEAPVADAAPGRRDGAAPGPPADRSVDALVEMVDLYPTFCDLLGLPTPGVVSGQSFVSLLDDPTVAHRDCVTAFLEEKEAHNIGADPDRPYLRGMMLRTDRWKLNVYADDTPELYDLRNDPAEDNNLAVGPSHSAHRLELSERMVQKSLETSRNPALWQMNQFFG